MVQSGSLNLRMPAESATPTKDAKTAEDPWRGGVGAALGLKPLCLRPILLRGGGGGEGGAQNAQRTTYLCVCALYVYTDTVVSLSLSLYVHICTPTYMYL